MPRDRSTETRDRLAVVAPVPEGPVPPRSDRGDEADRRLQVRIAQPEVRDHLHVRRYDPIEFDRRVGEFPEHALSYPPLKRWDSAWTPVPAA